jgi:hypothetical protein
MIYIWRYLHMFSIFYHFFVKCFDLHIPSASSARLSWLYPCSFPLGNRRIPHTCLSQRYFPRDLGFLKMFKSLPCPQRVQTFRLCFQLCTTSEQTSPPNDDSLTEKGSLQSLVRNGSIGIWGKAWQPLRKRPLDFPFFPLPFLGAD